jgi:hypothetical protein
MSSHSPRRNLPVRRSQKRGESNFVTSFVRCFVSSASGSGLGIRELQVSGYGIPDFVWVSRNSGCESLLHLTAFEMKLNDWKGALTQAYRYSYFADQTIVVLPPRVAQRAYSRIDVFRRAGIGLWSYDRQADQVQLLIRSNTHGPRNVSAKIRTTVLFRRSVKFRHFLKSSQAF